MAAAKLALVQKLDTAFFDHGESRHFTGDGFGVL
jgi:hypothetical protein